MSITFRGCHESRQSCPHRLVQRGTYHRCRFRRLRPASRRQCGIETVVVTDSRLNLDLLPGKILDTPATIDVVPATVIRDQGVNNLEDALKNVPGITLNSGEGGTHGDLVNLRGFSVSDDYFLDGMRDTGLYTRDTFDYESLEVLKGPSSTLFGRGTTGGAINQVSKSPELYPIEDFSLTGGNNAEARGTADVNYVMGDTSAVRLNLMGQRNNFVDQPYARDQRWGVGARLSPVALAPTPCVTLKYLHQQQDDIPDTGVPFLFGQPAPVSKSALLWPALRRPLQDRCRGGDGQSRAQVQ